MSRDDEVIRKIIIQRFAAALADLTPYIKHLTFNEMGIMARIQEVVDLAEIRGIIQNSTIKGDSK